MKNKTTKYKDYNILIGEDGRTMIQFIVENSKGKLIETAPEYVFDENGNIIPGVFDKAVKIKSIKDFEDILSKAKDYEKFDIVPVDVNKRWLEKHIDKIAWVTVALGVAAIIYTGTKDIKASASSNKDLSKKSNKNIEQEVNQNENKTEIEKVIDEELSKDGINEVISYEEVLQKMSDMYGDITQTLENNNSNAKLDFENIEAFYVLYNMENIGPDVIRRLQDEGRIPTDSMDFEVACLPVMDIIGHEITAYMYGNDKSVTIDEKNQVKVTERNVDNLIDLRPYIVDTDKKTYMSELYKMVEEVREYNKNENTDETKESAQKMYENIYKYMRNENGSILGTHNNVDSGIAKVGDLVFINSLLQGLGHTSNNGKSAYITQKQIDAITGYDIDPATGEKIERTEINNWEKVIRTYEDACVEQSKTKIK